MKKTLIALLALSGVAMADATLGSYYTVGGTKYDAVDNFYGYTKDQIIAKTSEVTVDQLAFDANSIGNLSAVTLNTADMLCSDSSLTTGTALTLSSLSILARANDGHKGVGSSVAITIDGVTYTSTTTTYSDGDIYTDDAGSTLNGHGLITYTFVDKLPTFELGDTLTFSFSLTDGTVADENKIPAAALKGISAAPIIYGGVWQAAMQLNVDTVTVPEPTTATLSLLALAGLAARRRRR